MRTVRDQYIKYSLIFLLLFFAVVLIDALLPFLSGFLGAMTIYILVRKQMIYLCEKKKIKPALSSLLIIIEIILCVLIPTFLVFWMLLGKVKNVNLDIQPLIQMIQHAMEGIQAKTGYDVLNLDNISAITGYASKFIQLIIGQASSIIVNSVVLIFLLYFMLIGNREMERFIYELLPFHKENKQTIIHETKRMVVANAIGIPLLAIVQGFIALISYWIFDVPSPWLFCILTCFATIIPIVGTGLVWFPLVVYFAIIENWVGAIGLAAYSLLITTNVDNLVRLLLQKKIADTHPLITVFGVIIGLTLFGFWGIIFGPLMLSMFFLLLRMFKKEYLDNFA